MTHPDSLQSIFLERVKARLPANVSFADELSELLNISKDSAYRRMRGETILSLGEAKILYDRYGISIDELFSSDSNMVTFHRRVVTYDAYDLNKWQNSILKNLEHLAGFADKKLIFSAKDVPVFHYFRLPDLCRFKHFFWMKTLIGYPDYEKKKYTADAVPDSLVTTAQQVWKRYGSLPSSEIWNEEVIFDTLKQIEFYHECNFFENPKEAIALCDQLSALLNLVEAEAAQGVKEFGGEFLLYKNEILISDNSVFAKMGDTRCVYVNQNALNLLLTLQEPFCEQTEIYLNNLIAKSVLISKTAERERTRFFNNMKERIDFFKQRMK
ncbi:MAG TPA: helix-turn-helix transcriptional regulator [Chryseosolibacter sp.]